MSKLILNNEKALIKDLIQGDESIVKRDDFDSIEYPKMQKAFNLIIDNPNLSAREKQYLMLNSWRMVFREKPPSIEEFLTTEWIGPTALDLYPHVKEMIIEYMNPSNDYRYAFLSTGIGWGKSTSTAIIILYILTHLSLMRRPKKYLNIAEITPIGAGLGSFTINQARRVLTKPFLSLLQSSPKFRNVKFEDRLNKVQDEEIASGSNKIVWTQASSMGSFLQLYNDLHIVPVSDSTSMLGMSLITGAVSEISFFIKKGFSPEEVNMMLTELKGRIFNRFSTNYYARMVIDSSPLSWDNKLEREIFSGEKEKDPLNFVVKGVKHWEIEAYKLKYPKFNETKETFKIFTGSAGKPTKIIDNIKETENMLPQEIVDVPIDLFEIYKDNPEKTVQDYLGIPSNGEDKLITDYSIIEKMFDPQLKNIIDSITAPADKNPEKLIWDKIKSKFFIEVQPNQYEFYRAPKEQRFIAIDQSVAKDVTCIAMVHPELDIKGEVVIVTDFTINIVPTKEKINLDAIIEFILDLRTEGKIYIDTVTFDQFQSDNGIQKLKRNNINVKKLSVDGDKGPYYTTISQMKRGKLKSGRNIFLKNNYKSLIEISYEKKAGTKVEHTKGKIVVTYDGNWKTSQCGINAKDSTDAQAGATYMCVTTLGTNYVPKYQYIANISKEKTQETILNGIKERFGLVIKQ